MQNAGTNEMDSQEGGKQCLQCNEVKPFTAFSRDKGNADTCKKVCCECEVFNRHQRRNRAVAQRDAGQWQQEWEKRRQQDWERKIALLHDYEERWRDQEAWYLQQPDRLYCACHHLLPATAFGGTPSASGFTLHTRCKTCHEALREHRQIACCFCQKKTPHAEFVTHYNGYGLSCDGSWLSLCCKGCEAALSLLSDAQQYRYIDICCRRAFPRGQVIYAEVDPETDQIRYIGRTSNPKRRHAQHLVDASPAVARWGPERNVWYTRGNWISTLAEKGLTPSMRILQHVEVSPLVLEWELRTIWHGMQQGWPLLNSETMDEKLVARLKAVSFDFLTEPFETLVEQHFFSSMGLVAFLRKWYPARTDL